MREMFIAFAVFLLVGTFTMLMMGLFLLFGMLSGVAFNA